MTIRQSATRRAGAREHTPREILLAAADVFARGGYAAATLAELAEAAGFAAPSLYRYFESKEEIFRSLVELLLGELDATFEEPVDRSRPLGPRLEALLRAQSRIAQTFRSAFTVLHAAGPELAAIVPQLRSPRAGLEYYESRFVVWLRRNADRAELRDSPELAARAFAGIAFAFRPCPDDPRPVEPEPERIRRIVDLALHGFAAPASRRRGATP